MQGSCEYCSLLTPLPLGPLIPLPTFLPFFGKNVFDIDPPAQYVVAPRKTPPAIVKLLEQTLEKVTKDPEFVNNLKSIYAGIQFIDGQNTGGRFTGKTDN